MKKWVGIGLGALAVLGLAAVGIQLIPTGVEANPPVVQGPAWDSPRTAQLAHQAGCMDCHSNETVWPWYGRVAPMSWLVAEHVADGRSELNLSEMHLPQEEAHEAGEAVSEGEMPPAYYTLLHPSAKLTQAEKRELVAGLNATLGGEGDGDEERHAAMDDDDDSSDD